MLHVSTVSSVEHDFNTARQIVSVCNKGAYLTIFYPPRGIIISHWLSPAATGFQHVAEMRIPENGSGRTAFDI